MGREDSHSVEKADAIIVDQVRPLILKRKNPLGTQYGNGAAKGLQVD